MTAATAPMPGCRVSTSERDDRLDVHGEPAAIDPIV
jgi:hypothetical protein